MTVLVERHLESDMHQKVLLTTILHAATVLLIPAPHTMLLAVRLMVADIHPRVLTTTAGLAEGLGEKWLGRR